jgi:hypothetical protein
MMPQGMNHCFSFGGKFIGTILAMGNCFLKNGKIMKKDVFEGSVLSPF